VTPDNPDRVFIGGGATRTNDAGNLNGPGDANFGATFFRVDVGYTTAANGGISNVSGALHYIGGSVHPDVHAIVFPPDTPDEVWVGCDDGVFYSDNAPGTDEPAAPRLFFEAKNTGLQTLMMHHLGQHPEEEAVLFGGTQDNGCLRFTGEEAWLHAQSGDCGFVVVNWINSYRVLAGLQFQAQEQRPLMVRSSVGGNLDTFNTLANPPSDVDVRTLFYYPLAGTPPGTSAPNRVVFGSLQP
jgi:hypothetical protein